MNRASRESGQTHCIELIVTDRGLRSCRLMDESQ